MRPEREPASPAHPDQDGHGWHLWNQYWADRDIESRNRLLLSYSPLVKWVVGRLPLRARERVGSDDLVSYGLIGLIDAIERFSPAAGIKFETYATFRVRGAILDELRRLDFLPRSVRAQARLLDATRSDLQEDLGRSPTTRELSERTGLDPETVTMVAGSLAAASPTGLDGVSETLAVDDDRFDAAIDEIDMALAGRQLREAMDRLPDRERTAVALYYLEGLTLAQVGEVLGVTESRVSQLRSRALQRLAEMMGASPALAAGA